MIRARVDALREQMDEHRLYAYLLPGGDPHGNAYPPPLWQRRRFISGFTGSAGDVVFTEKVAGLWTDPRYHLQAEEELDLSVYTLFRSGSPGVPSYERWLAEMLETGQRVGVDPRLIPCRDYEKMRKKLEAAGIVLCSVDENLVDAVWPERPGFPKEGIKVHDLCYAGQPFGEKLSRLRKEMAAFGAVAHVLTLPEDVAWLFNLRGGDVDFTPVPLAFAIVTQSNAELYLDLMPGNDPVRRHLGPEVLVKSYNDFQAGLERLRAARVKTWIDPETCHYWVRERLEPGALLMDRPSPLTLFRAIKNEREIQGFREVHVRDGVAMVRFLKWLEEALPDGEVTEWMIAEKLEAFRARDDLYRGQSFPAIVGFRAHGAVVHYTPSPKSDVKIDGPGILVVDSGGQYLDGTTDVTRTLAIEGPTEEQKERFTRVLKGHIRLAMQAFPSGTKGAQLDALARCTLWDVGLEFGHGVGHGVGSYLSVHEFPPSISFSKGKDAPLLSGMVCSNEPGYYEEGEYGLRFENLMALGEAIHLSRRDKPFLSFEILTLVPVDLKLIKKSLLAKEELQWFCRYHRKVRETLSPLLDPAECAWLVKATSAP